VEGLGWTVVGRTQMRRSLVVPIATLRACPARRCSRGEAWVPLGCTALKMRRQERLTGASSF